MYLYTIFLNSQEEMHRWIMLFQHASTEDVGPGHSQTLPLRRSAEERGGDEQKRRSLFAMKKK